VHVIVMTVVVAVFMSVRHGFVFMSVIVLVAQQYNDRRNQNASGNNLSACKSLTQSNRSDADSPERRAGKNNLRST
jgi:hypothetical protein